MLTLALTLVLGAAPVSEINVNRTWDRLQASASDADRRRALHAAAQHLQGVEIDLAGTSVTGTLLAEIAGDHGKEPLLRVARELLRRPVDLDDFLLFLDDLIAARATGQVSIPASRARSVGIFVHPYDVFRPERARYYGASGGVVPLDPPPSQDGLRPAKDGDPVGPRWAARYQQPETSKARLAELAGKNPNFARRVKSLLTQLKNQGAYTEVESAVRRRERGYLIYGSWWLGQANDSTTVDRRIRTLKRLRRKWKLRVPIVWRHPGGWRATVEAARQLADTYSVDYATRKGAKRSKHYDGRAVDFWAVDLPRTVTLQAPDGVKKTFDLSHARESRDLNLTPQLIAWIETHFEMQKLKTDYPHWNDSAKRRSRRSRVRR